MGIKEIRETTESCKHCFMCRHACPTFLTTKLDSHTPRGYALLLSEIDHGLQSWTDSIVERFYQCSQCGLCREDCAYHWAEDEVVRNAREEIVSQGLAPERVKAAASAIMADHSPYGVMSEEWIPASATPEKHGAEVLYFAGCATRQKHPSILQALDRILGAAGVDWTVMEDEGCCGVPLFELGYSREAKEAARALAQKIRELKSKVLLTGCPHCYRAFKEFYPKWDAPLSKDLTVLHVSQYIESLVSRGALKLKTTKKLSRASYHDPCQLGRKMREFDAPRKLIQAAAGALPLELFHHRENAECCGSGSCLFLTDARLAHRIARRRIEGLREADSHVLITACQNCKTGFESALAQEGFEVQVLDLAELVAMAI
jgi:Fe-S oxidoreductase